MKQNKPYSQYSSHSEQGRKWHHRKKNNRPRKDFYPDRKDNQHRDSGPKITMPNKDYINLPSIEKSPIYSNNTDKIVGTISQLMSWFRKNFSFWVKPTTSINEVK